MERVGAARDLVLGYVHALNAIDEAVRVVLPSLERLADVLGLARSHRISRSGHIGAYSYMIHGAGCRFVSDNGTEVDVDFAADGGDVFEGSRAVTGCLTSKAHLAGEDGCHRLSARCCPAACTPVVY
ncbi:DUF6896 domain-containing protein [Streptomyces sp. NPDC048438]|uniref:DUF6896 domain-containing protein n=1 Tax=Streptomyces sp. NPDC048438 TaxID=3365551 RepID=UPI0037217DDE